MLAKFCGMIALEFLENPSKTYKAEWKEASADRDESDLRNSREGKFSRQNEKAGLFYPEVSFFSARITLEWL